MNFPPATPRAALPTIRTIVVDDKPTVVDGIRQCLAAQTGVTVVAVALNARDAIDQVEQHQPDLLVMDVHMPELSGLNAANILHGRFPELRIILISIEQGAELQRECLRHGADRFLPKIGLHRTLGPEIRQLFPDRVMPESSTGAVEGTQT